jgi:hypothetical protein
MDNQKSRHVSFEDIVYISDVLLHILSYGNVLDDLCKLSFVNRTLHNEIQKNSLLWKFTAKTLACPICLDESIKFRPQFEIAEVEYWKQVSRIAVASRQLRRQYRMIFTSRIFVDHSTCTDGKLKIIQDNSIPDMNINMNMNGLYDKPYVMKRKSSFSWKTISGISSTICSLASQAIPKRNSRIADVLEVPKPSTIKQLPLVHIKTVERLLDNFLWIQSGILLSTIIVHSHMHDLDQAHHIHTPFNIALKKRKSVIRTGRWIECSATPNSNELNLPLLYPCSESRSTKVSTDRMELTIQALYSAVGGGVSIAGPVRWFVTQIGTLPNQQATVLSDRKEILVAICFFYRHDIDSNYLMNEPTVARIAAVTCTGHIETGWVAPSTEGGNFIRRSLHAAMERMGV